MAERVPSNWTKVAEVEIVPSHQVHGFFALSPDNVPELREHVREYFEPQAGSDRYAMRLF